MMSEDKQLAKEIALLRLSERKYRTLFENAIDAIFLMKNDVFIDCNLKTLEMFNCDWHHIIGKHPYDPEFSPAKQPDDRESKEKAIEKITLALEGKPQIFEWKHRQLQGKLFDAEVSLNRIELRERDILLAIVRDITERKQAEKALRESESKFRMLTEQSLMGIHIIQDSVFKYVNRATAEICGYSIEEIMNWGPNEFTKVIYPDDLPMIMEQARKKQSGEGNIVANYEWRLVTKTGEIKWIESFSKTIPFENRPADFVMMIDITERKHAEEIMVKRNRELYFLNQLGQLLAQSTTLQEVTRIAVKHALNIMHLPKGALFLIRDNQLKLITHQGTDEELASRLHSISLESGLAGYAIGTGKAITVKNAVAEKQIDPFVRETLHLAGIRSVACIPLKRQDETIGTLYLASNEERAFSPDDIHLLEAIGSQVGMAIERVRLLEELNELSVTDEVTGLGNRRRFYEVLADHLKRANRYKGSSCLALIDLDGFKEYNDRFGHINGDAILRSFGQTLRSGMRKRDRVFRYGGDEFAVIMPSTDTAKARKTMERIRGQWERISLAFHWGQDHQLTFSAGIVRLIEDAETADGLIFLADTALYQAKQGGGSRSVCVQDIALSDKDREGANIPDLVYGLAATVDAKDPMTYGHSTRVAEIAERIGKVLGFSKRQLAKLRSAALLHDIGKVGVPDSVLRKSADLRDDEWQLVRKHPAEGARIVGHIRELSDLVPAILHHHERYDGSGYPDGLEGKEIPLAARVIAVADAYDTMIAERLYRESISNSDALAEIRRFSGSQFDPQLVDVLSRVTSDDLVEAPHSEPAGHSHTTNIK